MSSVPLPKKYVYRERTTNKSNALVRTDVNKMARLATTSIQSKLSSKSGASKRQTCSSDAVDPSRPEVGTVTVPDSKLVKASIIPW